MACLVIAESGERVGVHPLGRVGSLMSVVYGIMTLISDLESSGLLLNYEEECAGFCLPNRRPQGHDGAHFMILENKQDILTARYVYMDMVYYYTLLFSRSKIVLHSILFFFRNFVLYFCNISLCIGTLHTFFHWYYFCSFPFIFFLLIFLCSKMSYSYHIYTEI